MSNDRPGQLAARAWERPPRDVSKRVGDVAVNHSASPYWAEQGAFPEASANFTQPWIHKETGPGSWGFVGPPSNLP